MATPIFEKADANVAGVFTANEVALTMKDSLIGALVQGLNLTYAQSVTRMYEINTSKDSQKANVYLVGGRAQGQMQLNRVIGPNACIKRLYQEYGNVCNACSANNDMSIDVGANGCGQCNREGGGCGENNVVYVLKNCVLTQVGVSMQAQEMIINEQAQVMFCGMDYS